MDITASYTFNAPRERVWDLMLDPAAIATCIPGCEALEPDGDNRYRAKITIGMAAITGTSRGHRGDLGQGREGIVQAARWKARAAPAS